MPKIKKATPSKSDFIRSQPPSLSPAEVVKKGKARGIKFSPQLVYNVRRYNKSKSKTNATYARATPGTAVVRPIATSSKAEDLLRAVAAEIGLGRAIELLEADRARVHGVLRG